MNRNEIESWQNALDVAEEETRDHWDMDVPPLNPGQCWQGPDGRQWQQVEIEYGAVGGRWCYWKMTSETQHGDVVIVDTIFNGWSFRFAGMLRIPYDGNVRDSLMLVNSEKHDVPQTEKPADSSERRGSDPVQEIRQGSRHGETPALHVRGPVDDGLPTGSPRSGL